MTSSQDSVSNAWRVAYHSRRYCQALSQAELDRRIRDIALRLITLTPDGKIGLLPPSQEGMRFLELFTHVQEEMAIRYGPYPAGFTRKIFHSEPLPDFAGSLAARASARLEHLRGRRVLIKFGKPDYMRALVEKGQLRVQAASYYRRPDHNGAVRDDELTLDVALHLDREAILKVVRNPQDVPFGPISQRLDLQYQSATDYWLYCLTSAVEARLFVDFEAQACVVIKDPERFATAIRKAMSPMAEAATFRQGEVTYVDPLLPTNARIDVPMSKHFRYSHQREYRFAWIPHEPQDSLAHFDIELGSMTSYAELITI